MKHVSWGKVRNPTGVPHTAKPLLAAEFQFLDLGVLALAAHYCLLAAITLAHRLFKVLGLLRARDCTGLLNLARKTAQEVLE